MTVVSCVDAAAAAPQVLFRILGTTAGSTVGFAAVLVAPNSAPALAALLVAFAFALAPLASASLHMRLAIALTYVSASVLVFCRYNVAEGRATTSNSFFAARVLQVRAGTSAGMAAAVLQPGTGHAGLALALALVR
jgi:hypothetical protein